MSNENTQVSDEVMATLNNVWRVIQNINPDVPDVFLVVQSSGASGRGYLTYGHYAYGSWEVADQRTPEVMLSGECLRAGADQILQTLLHEAVHGLAHKRDIKEVSRQNRYHNARFRVLAEEVGLDWPLWVDELGFTYFDKGKRAGLGVLHPPDVRIGYSAVQLTDETRALYRTVLGWLEALPVTKGDGRGAPSITPGPKRILTGCGCREITFGHVQWGVVAPLVCGSCGGQYKRQPRVDEEVDHPDGGIARWGRHFDDDPYEWWHHRSDEDFGDCYQLGDWYPSEWDDQNNGIAE